MNNSKSNITDMTFGSPSSHIIKFAVPLLIGNLFQQLYNMVDSLIVGNFVGANALASVGTCGSVSFLFFALSSGLALGIGIIVSQYFGAKNEEKVRVTIGNSFYVLIAASLVVSLIGIFFSPFIMTLLQCPEIIKADAITYLRTSCYGIVFIALYNGVAAILRALGDSKTPLYFLILSSIVNVVLDLVFVLCFDWAVFGVAFATVVSQAVSAIASLIYAFKKVPYFNLSKAELMPHKTIIVNSFKLGVPISLQNSLIAISCIVLQGVVNTFGETVMAAYTVTMRIEQLVQQPFSSLGMALTSYAGQNFGAQRIDRVKKGMHRATFMVMIFSLIMLPIFYIFGDKIIYCFVKEPEVISIGAKALRITSLFYFFLGMIYAPRSLLNGCGDTAFSMINGITEVICRISFSILFTSIATISIFGHTYNIGYWGIWLTTGLTWFTTALICFLRYKLGSWRKKMFTN